MSSRLLCFSIFMVFSITIQYALSMEFKQSEHGEA